MHEDHEGRPVRHRHVHPEQLAARPEGVARQPKSELEDFRGHLELRVVLVHARGRPKTRARGAVKVDRVRANDAAATPGAHGVQRAAPGLALVAEELHRRENAVARVETGAEGARDLREVRVVRVLVPNGHDVGRGAAQERNPVEELEDVLQDVAEEDEGRGDSGNHCSGRNHGRSLVSVGIKNVGHGEAGGRDDKDNNYGWPKGEIEAAAGAEQGIGLHGVVRAGACVAENGAAAHKEESETPETEHGGRDDVTLATIRLNRERRHGWGSGAGRRKRRGG
mmetsp:Transcript_26665/g.78483  ORF Transcript_26665/g.78483 Transcript_26665/m.78483 type:complete len:281 (+) Transcript_26665:2399-3241(+)